MVVVGLGRGGGSEGASEVLVGEKTGFSIRCIIFLLGGADSWHLIYTEQKKKGILNLVLNYAFFIQV